MDIRPVTSRLFWEQSYRFMTFNQRSYFLSYAEGLYERLFDDECAKLLRDKKCDGLVPFNMTLDEFRVDERFVDEVEGTSTDATMAIEDQLFEMPREELDKVVTTGASPEDYASWVGSSFVKESVCVVLDGRPATDEHITAIMRAVASVIVDEFLRRSGFEGRLSDADSQFGFDSDVLFLGQPVQLTILEDMGPEVMGFVMQRAGEHGAGLEREVSDGFLALWTRSLGISQRDFVEGMESVNSLFFDNGETIDKVVTQVERRWQRRAGGFVPNHEFGIDVLRGLAAEGLVPVTGRLR